MSATTGGQVLFLDDFSQETVVNPEIWNYVHYQKDNNPAFFGRTAIRQSLPPIAGGAADLQLDTYNPKPGPDGPSLYGSDIYTYQTFEPGSAGLVFQVVARLGQTQGGLVGGIFPYLLLDPNPPNDHDEIDAELVSNSLTNLSVNNYDDQPLGAGNGQNVSLPHGVSLTNWNTYQMVWLPNEIRWYVDGILVYETASNVPTGAMPLYLDLWAPSNGSNGWDYAYNSGLQPVGPSSPDTQSDFYVSSVLVTQPLGNVTLSDYDAGIHSNLFWQNTGDDYVMWTSAGGPPEKFAAVNLGYVDPSWQIEATGDFNGDRKTDVLWRNTDGDVAVWNSNGSGGFSGQDLGGVGLDWQIAGVGDFNADGRADILWRNADGDVGLWNSNRSGGFAFENLGDVNSGWQVAGVGDFNGSGKSDILWRNADGDLVVWNSNGSGGFGGQDLGVVGLDWQVAGVGDFDGSGRSDILWRNTDRDVRLWVANGSGGFTPKDLGVMSAGWQIEGVGDLNGDGKSDIVWRNSLNGDAAVWNANPGSSVGFTSETLSNVGSNWQVYVNNGLPFSWPQNRV